MARTVLALLLFALPAHAQEAPELPSPCEGSPVASVRLAGCEESRCADPEEQARLLALTGLVVGEPVGEGALERAAERLRRVAAFDTVRQDCRLDGGAHVVLHGTPLPIIRRLRIEGNSFVLQEELRKRVFLRPGSTLAPAQAEEVLTRQQETLRKYYEREGFVDTAVRAVAHPLEGQELEVVIAIDEGRKNRIDRREVRFARRAERPEAGRAAVEGALGDSEGEQAETPLRCLPVSEGDLAAAAQLGELEVFTERAARDVRNRLRAWLQARGYVEPKVDVRYEPERALLRVEATWEACWAVRFFERPLPAVGDEGYKLVTEVDDLLEVLPFSSSGTFDFDEADLGRRTLQEDLERQGLLFAEVALDWRRFDRRRPAAGERVPVSDTVRGAITYFITRGSVTEIRAIQFPGMTALDEDDVRDTLATKVYDFFGPGGYLGVEQMFADLRALRASYHALGYYRMRFRGFSRVDAPVRRVERRDRATLYVWQVEDMGFTARKPDRGNVLYLEVPIEEGTRSVLSGVDVSGTDKVLREDALGALGLRAGQPFSQTVLKQAFQRLRGLYLDRGHPDASVTVRCSTPEGGCDPAEVTAEQVSLVFEVEEGPEVRIGEVFLLGNFETEPSVILRDVPESGDLYRPAAIGDAERRLRALGVFSTVRIDAVGLEEEPMPDRVALLVRLEESRARFLDLAVGFESINREGEDVPAVATSVLATSVSTTDRLQGFQGRTLALGLPDLLVTIQAEYIDQNVAGLAKELRIPLKYGLSAAGLLEADLFRLLVFAPTWLDRRLFGSELVFRATPFFTYDEVSDVFDQIEGGLQLELSRRFFDHLITSLSFEVSGISTRDPSGVAGAATADFSTPSLQNKLEPRVAWDALDNPLHPMEGWYLGGTLSYINALDLGTRTFANFLKADIEAKGVLNIGRFLVLASFARFGASATFDADTLPLTERFRLGGNKGVRGYGDGEIRQYEADGTLRETPIGGDFVLNGTGELRLPIVRDLGSLSLWGAGFFDWGALADDIDGFNARSFRMAAGVGLRLLLYDQLPLRLDYGIKLDRRCLVASSETGACEQEEPLGELSFGILYTF
ncbi:MAG: hypothetical protein AMXMBFR64_17310 [Myxococcales bacterium]